MFVASLACMCCRFPKVWKKKKKLRNAWVMGNKWQKVRTAIGDVQNTGDLKKSSGLDVADFN